MSHADVTTPRLLYKGPADETAETCRVEDQHALDEALKGGWRLQRVEGASAADRNAAKARADKGTLKVPAQTVIVDQASAPANPDGQVRADAATQAARHTAATPDPHGAAKPAAKADAKPAKPAAKH